MTSILQYEHPLLPPSSLSLLPYNRLLCDPLSPPFLYSTLYTLYDIVLYTTQAAVKDKLSLQAEVASLQKINMNLARGKDVLEARVNTHAVYVFILRTLTTHAHVSNSAWVLRLE